jgi:hypothetical protein
MKEVVVQDPRLDIVRRSVASDIKEAYRISLFVEQLYQICREAA